MNCCTRQQGRCAAAGRWRAGEANQYPPCRGDATSNVQHWHDHGQGMRAAPDGGPQRRWLLPRPAGWVSCLHEYTISDTQKRFQTFMGGRGGIYKWGKADACCHACWQHSSSPVDQPAPAGSPLLPRWCMAASMSSRRCSSHSSCWLLALGARGASTASKAISAACPPAMSMSSRVAARGKGGMLGFSMPDEGASCSVSKHV